MGRAERRREQKKAQKRPAVYTFTKEMAQSEVEKMVKAQMDKERDAIMNEAVNQAMLLLFVLPMQVLMDFYWKKSYAKRIPEFTQHLLDYYSDYQDGKLDMDKMKDNLWVYGGVRLEEKEE